MISKEALAYTLGTVGLLLFAVAMCWWGTSALQAREVRRRRAARAKAQEESAIRDAEILSPHPGYSCDSKCDLTDRAHGYGGFFIGDKDEQVQDRVETALSIANPTWSSSWTRTTGTDFEAVAEPSTTPAPARFASVTATRGKVQTMEITAIPELVDLEPVSGEILEAPVQEEMPSWIDDLDAGADEVMSGIEEKLEEGFFGPVLGVRPDDTLTFTLSAGTVAPRAVGSVRMATAADDIRRAGRFELDPLGSWYVDRGLEEASIFNALAAEFNFLSVPAGELVSA